MPKKLSITRNSSYLNTLRAFSLIGVAAFFFQSASLGQIVYTQPSDPIVVPLYDESPIPDRRIDILGDGNFELFFRSGTFFSVVSPELSIATTSFRGEPLASLRFVSLADDPSNAQALGFGDWIGPEANWSEGSGLVMWRNLTTFEGVENESWGGSFFDAVGFYGFELELEDEDVLFGWIRLDGTDAESVGLQVIDWAYNSVPGDSIRAGEIPEPRAVALIAGMTGFVLVLMRRRTRRSR